MTTDTITAEQVIADQLQEAWGSLHRALECNHAEQTITRLEARIEELRTEQIEITGN